jgi:hypothetical protein
MNPVHRAPGTARAGLVRRAAAVAALALLATACSTSTSAGTGTGPGTGTSPPAAGSGGPASAGGSASLAVGVSYAGCMRSHGVPEYPDPAPGNALADGLPKVSPQELQVSNVQYQAAQHACAHVLPNDGQPTQAQAAEDLTAMRRFAQCMRSHGVPGWPDPTDDPAYGWGFNLLHVTGFDPSSTQIDNLMDECDRALPPGIGVPLARPGRPG